MNTYRVEITDRNDKKVTVAHGVSRETAINAACDWDKWFPRIWNEQTGDEVVNGSDGRIKEI